MACAFIGYGFNINDINEEQIEDFVKNFDKNYYEEICDVLKLENDNTFEAKDVVEYIIDHRLSMGEYLSEVINFIEQVDVLAVYDNYLVFDSIRFIGDNEERANYIRTEEDFINLIAKYFPVEGINFGNLYDGIDWVDPNYFMD